MHDRYETMRDLVLACVLKTRYVDESELMERFVRLCDKHRVLPIVGQLKTSLDALKTAGQIVYVKGRGIRRS